MEAAKKEHAKPVFESPLKVRPLAIEGSNLAETEILTSSIRLSQVRHRVDFHLVTPQGTLIQLQ